MDEIVYVNRVSYVINSWRKIQIKYFKEFITIKKKNNNNTILHTVGRERSSYGYVFVVICNELRIVRDIKTTNDFCVIYYVCSSNNFQRTDLCLRYPSRRVVHRTRPQR